MKLYNKSELTFVNGYITKGEEILDLGIIAPMLNELETRVQKARFDAKHQNNKISLDEESFERKSAFTNELEISCVTPMLDQKAKESMSMLKEIAALEDTEKFNEIAKQYQAVVDWVHDDKIIADADGMTLNRFDLPTLGNPLKLTTDKLARYFKEASRAENIELHSSDEELETPHVEEIFTVNE